MQAFIPTFCTLLLLTLSWSLAAQPTSGAIPNAKGEPERTPCNVPPPPQCLPSPYHLMKEEEEIFKVVEEMPRFPGCEELPTAAEKKQCADKKMLEYLYRNIIYPALARENCAEGTVVIQFVIEKDGSVTNARAVRDIGARCGEEALRVVNLMNEQGLKWIPGKQRGRTVRVQFNLPVKFRIDCPEMQPTAAFQEPAPGPDAREEIPEQADEALPPTEATPSGTPLTFEPEGFRLFPNPAADRLNLCLQPGPGQVALSIANTSGQLLWKQEYKDHGGILEEQVSLAQWPSGTYLLSIEQAGTRQSHPFIKHP